MKVLMLGWELPPHNSGGLGVACFQLGKALAARDDVDLEFVLPYRDDDLEIDFMTITSAVPMDVEVVLSAGGAYASHLYRFHDRPDEWHDVYGQAALYEEAVAALAPVLDYDVVHAHDWLTFKAALRLKEHSGKPIVLHIHALESDRAGGHRGNAHVHDIEAEGLALADRIVAVSAFTKRRIVGEYGVDPERISVIHNSLDWQAMEPADGDNSYRYLEQLKGQGWHVVSNIGRLTMQKGITHLLQAAVGVVARVPKTMFLIVGSGDQYHELTAMAAELGIGRNVMFAEFQRGKRWRDSFAIADLFVMPSVSEPFGLTPLEAAAYGTPSLITHQSGVSEVLEHSLKVDFWDVQRMTDEIVAVLTDDARRTALGEGARAELETLSWQRAADDFAEVYRSLLEARP